MNLTTEQLRFIWLHQRTTDAPFKWKWIFSENALRAYTERGHTATITRKGLLALATMKLVMVGLGDAVSLTETGRATA